MTTAPDSGIDEEIFALRQDSSAAMPPRPRYNRENAILNYIESLIDSHGRVSMAYYNFPIMPSRVIQKLGDKVEYLDLGHNEFEDLSFLMHFPKLHTVILDRNSIRLNTFPLMPNLRLLWINNCDIKNLNACINMLSTQCPNLEHLSIMGNPFGRTELNGRSGFEEEEYRMGVVRILKNLKVLDGRPITDELKRKAFTVYPIQCTSRDFFTKAWNSCSETLRNLAQ